MLLQGAKLEIFVLQDRDLHHQFLEVTSQAVQLQYDQGVAHTDTGQCLLKTGMCRRRGHRSRFFHNRLPTHPAAGPWSARW